MTDRRLFRCLILAAACAFLIPASDASAQAFDACSLLADPVTRSQLGSALETKLRIQCGEITAEMLQQLRSRGPDTAPAPNNVTGNILVNNPLADSGGTTQSETSIVVLGSTVCAAWNDSGEGFGTNGFSGFGYSNDGGTTWTDGGAFPTGPGSDRNFGDPSLAYSMRDNTFYFAALSNAGLSLWGSTNSCQSFAYVAPIHVGGGDDKDLMAVDNNPASPFYGRIYVGWTDFARATNRNVTTFSDDGGLTWSTPAVLPGSGTAGQGMWPAIAPNGDLYFAVLNRGGFIGSTQDQWIYRSTNGGVSWSQRADIATNDLRPERVADTLSCGRQALNDEIRNLSSPQIAIHADPAATAGYVIHATYSHDSDGGGQDESNVFYRRSVDGAASWSAEVMLNDDGTVADQWFPAIAVNSAGVVAVTWYDRRTVPASNSSFERYATTSMDGGLTWAPNTLISDAVSPVSQNNPQFDGLAACYHGDYDQIAIDGTDAHILWSDDRRATGSGPNPDVYYARLSLLAAGTPAISSPAPGSVLPGATAAFQWTANGVAVTGWQLDVGSSLGASDYYTSGALGAGTLSDTATGLPVNGTPVFVRLTYQTAGGPQAVDAQYSAAVSLPAITGPAAGSVLPGASVNFQWVSNGTAVTMWELNVGSTPGSPNLARVPSIPPATLNTTVNGLPTNGSQIYVTLWFLSGGTWQSVSAQYTAAAPPAVPAITSPVPGSVLAGASVNVQWTANGAAVTGWQLDVGSSLGASNYYTSGALGAGTLSATATGLPLDGSTVFARLTYQTAGGPQFVDAQYTAAAAGAPAIVGPPPGSVLPGASVNFQWVANGTAVTTWELNVGSTPGSPNLARVPGIPAGTLNATVNGLPTNGSQIYVTLWFRSGGIWRSVSAQYTAAASGAVPAITSPPPGSVLSGSSVNFQWTANGAAVTGWQLDAGSSVGASNYYSSGALGAGTLSNTASGLPTDGTQVFVRLSFQTSAGTQFVDAVYTAAAAGPPAVVGPPPGSVLPGASVTFQWVTNGTAVTAWELNVGSSPGSANLALVRNIPAGTLSTTVNGLPTNGSQVYVRLWYRAGGVWNSTSTQYTAAIATDR